MPALRTDVAIEKENTFALRDPFWCRKIYLLNLVGLLDEATSGTIIFDGTDITSLSKKNYHRFRRENIIYFSVV